MSDRHTPGPWYVNFRYMDIGILAPDPDDDTPWAIADVTNYAGPGDATEANARLIAAAPELLDLVKTLHSQAKLFNRDSDSIWAAIDARFREVISKVEGVE